MDTIWPKIDVAQDNMITTICKLQNGFFGHWKLMIFQIIKKMSWFSRELFICKFPEGLLKLEHTHYNLGCWPRLRGNVRLTNTHTRFIRRNLISSTWQTISRALVGLALGTRNGSTGWQPREDLQDVVCSCRNRSVRSLDCCVWMCKQSSSSSPGSTGTGNNIPKWYGNIISAVTRSVATTGSTGQGVGGRRCVCW